MSVSPCRRFESEGLERLESGLSLTGHFVSCPDCVEQRAAYETLMRDLAELGKAEEPAADWQQQVRRRIRDRRLDAPQVSPLTSSRGWWPVASLAAAAGLAMAIFSPRWSEPPELSLATRVEHSTVAFRGQTARPGDVLVLDAEGDPDQHLELRLYLNDRQLVARCLPAETGVSEETSSSDCVSIEGRLSLRAATEGIGRYQPVVLQSPNRLPAPAGDLDADCGAVLEAGGRVELGEEIIVR